MFSVPAAARLRAQPAIDVKSLHAKIGELTLENDFLEGALTKAGLRSMSGDGAAIMIGARDWRDGADGIARSGPSVLRMITGTMEVVGAVMTYRTKRPKQGWRKNFICSR